MGNSATLSSKYQISIPKSVRDAQKWKPGQKLAFIAKGNAVLLVPILEKEDLFGIAKGADPTGYRDRDDRY
jgi:AbrB family looped-hinge helix DNA binding protein